MAKVIFAPPGNLSTTKLGLVEVEAGAILSRALHRSLLADRVQELIDQEELSLLDLKQLVEDSLAPEGQQVELPDELEWAGMYLVEGLVDKLMADGVLLSEQATAPMTDDPDLRETYLDIWIGEWISLASMPQM